MTEKKKSYDLFIFAGEASGDFLGYSLLSDLVLQKPNLQIASVSGPRMRQIPTKCLIPMEEFETMGFSDVICSLPKLFKQFHLIKNWILKNQPKMVIFIDYPEFSLRLEKSLKKHHFMGKIVHYVCPTIWAWRKNRIKLMEKSIDLLLTLFPFEENYLKNASFQTNLVQHPLFPLSEKLFSNKKPISFHEGLALGIFPGSRKKVIEKNLSKQLQIACKLHQNYPLQKIYVSCSNESFLSTIQEKISEMPSSCPFLICTEKAENLMQKIDLAIATSGTVNLQLGFFEIPTIVTYAINSFDLFLAQKIFKIHLNHYSLVNILSQKNTFPEFFGPNFQEKKVYDALKNFIENPSSFHQCQEELKNIKKLFLNSKSATESILAFF
jgi:lipid-A-disaccharide synthase